MSFNYDRVVEVAAAAAQSRNHGNGIEVLTYDNSASIDEELEDAREDEQPVLVKLHGSVDWKYDPERPHFKYEVSTAEHAVTAGVGSPLSIAAPGAGKQDQVNGELKPLWRYAEGKIKSADAIVFLGYRFPPSDAIARSRLLDAISRNRPDSRHRRRLQVRIVLGNDDYGVREATRLKGLIHYAARKARRELGADFHFDDDQLFAEDFLAVWDPNTV